MSPNVCKVTYPG